MCWKFHSAHFSNERFPCICARNSNNLIYISLENLGQIKKLTIPYGPRSNKGQNTHVHDKLEQFKSPYVISYLRFFYVLLGIMCPDRYSKLLETF